jgi:hypothetical protein
VGRKLAADGDPESDSDTEVEFDIDFNLRYSYTVNAIEAVSGKTVNGQVKKLIDKIKFKNNANDG